MERSQEEYEEDPFTVEQLTEQIQNYYVENISSIKNATPKEAYATQGARVWTEFVKESFQGPEEEDKVSWETYQKAVGVVTAKKFLFCVKTFAEVDDNGNGLVDLAEAQNHVNWKKISRFMGKDRNLDGMVSLAEFMDSVKNPFDDILDEYKFRYNNYLQPRTLRS